MCLPLLLLHGAGCHKWDVMSSATPFGASHRLLDKDGTANVLCTMGVVGVGMGVVGSVTFLATAYGSDNDYDTPEWPMPVFGIGLALLGVSWSYDAIHGAIIAERQFDLFVGPGGLCSRTVSDAA